MAFSQIAGKGGGSSSSSSCSGADADPASSSSSVIGRLWQEGENEMLESNYHDACLLFLRAKSILIEESKPYFNNENSGGNKNNVNSSNNNGQQSVAKMTKIYGELMEKLNKSIEKIIAMFTSNPILALGLHKLDTKSKDGKPTNGKINAKSFTPRVIKTSYRSLILKYHPDKNIDCDSTCLFQAIQVAYDKMNNMRDNSEKTPSSGAEGTSESAEASFPKSFYEWNQEREKRNAERDRKTSPRANAGASYAADSSSSSSSGANTNKTSGGSVPAMNPTVDLSSEKLKEVLMAFGFDEEAVRKMNREELVKKYLATMSYLNNNKQHPMSNNKYSANNANPKHDNPFSKDNKDQSTSTSSKMKDIHSQFVGINNLSKNLGLGHNLSRQFVNEMKKNIHEQDNYFKKLAKDVLGQHYDLNAMFGDLASGLNNNSNNNINGQFKSPYSSNDRAPPRSQRAGRRANANDNEGDDDTAAAPNDSYNNNNKNNNYEYRDSYDTKFKDNSRDSSRAGVGSRNRAASSNSNSTAGDDEPPKSARRQDADSNRQSRVNKLKTEIPTMSLNQLINLMNMSGLSSDGCVEKADLIAKLYHFYGIIEHPDVAPELSGDAKTEKIREKYAKETNFAHNPNPRSEKSDAAKSEVNNTSSSSKPVPIGQGLSAAESAMRSRFASRPSPNIPVPASEKSHDKEREEQPSSFMNSHMKASSSGNSSPRGGVSSAQPVKNMSSLNDINDSPVRKPNSSSSNFSVREEFSGESLKNIMGKLNISYNIKKSIDEIGVKNDNSSNNNNNDNNNGNKKLTSPMKEYVPSVGASRNPMRADGLRPMERKTGLSIPLHGLGAFGDDDDEDDNDEDDDDRDDDDDDDDVLATGRSGASYNSSWYKGNNNNRDSNQYTGRSDPDDDGGGGGGLDDFIRKYDASASTENLLRGNANINSSGNSRPLPAAYPEPFRPPTETSFSSKAYGDFSSQQSTSKKGIKLPYSFQTNNTPGQPTSETTDGIDNQTSSASRDRRPTSADRLRQTAAKSSNKASVKGTGTGTSSARDPSSAFHFASKSPTTLNAFGSNFSKENGRNDNRNNNGNDDEFDDDLNDIYNDILNYHFPAGVLFAASADPSALDANGGAVASNGSAGNSGKIRSPISKASPIVGSKESSIPPLAGNVLGNVPTSLFRSSASQALEIQEEVDFWLHQNN